MSICRRQIGGALILALATSYVVGWIVQTRSSPRTQSDFGPMTGQWLLGSRPLRLGCDQYWVLLEEPVFYGSHGSWTTSREPWLISTFNDWNASQAIIRTAGWPCRCLISGRTMYDDETIRDWGMVRFGGPETFAFPFKNSQPYRPLWIGLAANIGAYSLAWWTLLGGPITVALMIRRSRRKRSGRCPRCGYDLAGQREAGCPECGSGREPSPTADASRAAPVGTRT